MELSGFEVDVLDSKNCFLLAETQGEFSIDSFIDEVNFNKKDVDCEDEKEHTNIVADKYKYPTAVGVKRKIKCKNLSASTENAVVTMRQTWKGEEPLLVYNTVTESEAQNVLLPEISHSDPVDCSSFADFNEFNLCLNNMLSYDDGDIITDSLTPISLVPTDNIVHTSGISCSSTSKLLRSTEDPIGNWSQRLTHRSEDQLHHIFDINQLGDDIDLQHFRTDDQIRPQSVPTSDLQENKFDKTHEQKST